MKKYVKRDRYLQKLINRMNNGEIKVITGPYRLWWMHSVPQLVR